MRVARTLLAVLGAALCVVGVVSIIAGGLAIWADQARTADDGFFTTERVPLATATRAMVSDDLDVEDAPDFLGTTIRVRAASERPVFVGVGRRADVERYLAGVARDVADEVRFDPFRVTYARAGGSAAPPTPPGDQTFWAETAAGTDTTLTWELEKGAWLLVAMNTDASPGVAVSAQVGAKVLHITLIGVIILVAGLALIVVGVVLIRGRRGRRAPPQATPDGVDTFA